MCLSRLSISNRFKVTGSSFQKNWMMLQKKILGFDNISQNSVDICAHMEYTIRNILASE